MVNLDDLSVYRRYDSGGMLDRIHEFPEQCRQAWERALNFTLPAGYARVSRVVILGMGGSAIGGDLVSSLAAAEAGVPVLVHRDYNLPALVDDETLVIASSYSGMTEETLSAFEQALKKGAKKLAITTGGKLEAMARAADVPVFKFDYCAPPRAALPYSFFPILCFLQKLDLIGNKAKEVADTVEVLKNLSERINESIPLPENSAKQMASQAHGRLPVIYGSGILAEVARRWKTQVNENGKAWAFYEVFPELNHNAVVGYQFPVELAGRLFVVMLTSPLLSNRVRLRYRITGELMEKAGVSCRTVEGEGASPLSQMMSLVLFGDYISYYLAILYETDPSPVKVIDFLKARLARGE